MKKKSSKLKTKKTSIASKKIVKKSAAVKKKIPQKKLPAKNNPKKNTAKSVAQKKSKDKKNNLQKNANLKKAEKKSKAIVKKAEKKVEKKAEKTLPKNKIEKKSAENNAAKNVKATNDFKVGDYAVYPSHGVGKITAIEKTAVLGQDFSCYLMSFEKEKLTIRIPLKNSEKIGLRPLASKAQMEEVLSILRSGIKKMKGMWSRRAQEYEAKINSGSIIALAEVLRDLTRDIEDGDRSYSERIIYETAILRLAAEYATIYKTDFEEAKNKITTIAKDKLGSSEKQEKPARDIDFDDEDKDEESSDESEDDEDEDEEEEDDEDYFDDDEDSAPRKKRKK